MKCNYNEKLSKANVTAIYNDKGNKTTFSI